MCLYRCPRWLPSLQASPCDVDVVVAVVATYVAVELAVAGTALVGLAVRELGVQNFASGYEVWRT